MRRVDRLLPKLDRQRAGEALVALRFAYDNMALNSYEGMKESLDDLRDFVEPTKNV